MGGARPPPHADQTPPLQVETGLWYPGVIEKHLFGRGRGHVSDLLPGGAETASAAQTKKGALDIHTRQGEERALS